MKNLYSSIPGRAAFAAFSLQAFLLPFSETSLSGAEPEHIVPMEDFEGFKTDAEIAKVWYFPGHGGDVKQSIGRDHVGSGKQSLKVEYTTHEDKNKRYSAWCHVSKWDCSGTNAIQFWFKPDGSGRHFQIQLNCANSKGNNIHDLWDWRFKTKEGDTTPRIVTVPYSELEHNTRYADAPDWSPTFKPEALIEVAFYVGGFPREEKPDEPGSGVLYIDDIRAVRLPGAH